MNHIFLYIMIGFMFICVGLSTIYGVLALPVTLFVKVYRKIKYGEKIM